MPLFEVCCGILLLSFLYFLYNAIRPYFKCRVNCWFCQRNLWVPFKKRNAFVCSGCDQYNGFKEDGDYNRRIPEQYAQTKLTQLSRKFCASNGPDVCAPLQGFVNGLCDKCNKNQQLIVQCLNKFEPVREEMYWDEYEDYKFRLNHKYALCDRCQIYSTRKVQSDQAKLGTRMSNGITKTLSVISSLTGFSKKSTTPQAKIIPLKSLSDRGIKRHRHVRRKTMSSGAVADVAHFMLLTASSLICLAHLHHIQRDADLEELVLEEYLPTPLCENLPFIAKNGGWLALLAFLAHLMGMKYSTTRYTVPDLALAVSWPIVAALHALPPPTSDVLLFRLAFSAFCFVLSSAIAFLPKKRKHKKKPNTFSSAFSVASTPMSQCSSALSSRSHSVRDSNDSFMDFSFTVKDSANRSRNSPSRELGKTLNGLRLDDDDEQNDLSGGRSMFSPAALSPSPSRKAQGPFSSLTFNPSVRMKANTLSPTKAASVFNINTAAGKHNAGSVASLPTRPSKVQQFDQMDNPFASRSCRIAHSYGTPSLASVSQQETRKSSMWAVAVGVAVLSVALNAGFIIYYQFVNKSS